ncbi:hypothetical protein I302_104106 [Kwoniella bestiolae CBS 10118]|uniref:Uncharacterized protein n=1 Tax=Kwoniella bestiolae CBS 10118 TaxID=1296100 RepID=A0A1B9GAC2_9TREE|nr:hypothetical protein I302_02814 [Kwoniella bestiolae CBS 10118]OCF27964.1 hypothetical protein I302_02814 [Kwoniella bestiolae CBS 10118]
MSSTPQSQPFKTDSLLPTSLPSATLGRRRHISQTQTQSNFNEESSQLTTEERFQRGLDAEHERWNERIDREIKGVVDGLKDLIELADIGTSPSPLTSSTLPLHLPLRTSSLIRSAQNIRDIAHELKLLLVLGDEQGIAQRRDHEMDLIRRDIQRKRGEVGREFGGMLGLEGSEEEEGEKGEKAQGMEEEISSGQDVQMGLSESIPQSQVGTIPDTTQSERLPQQDQAQSDLGHQQPLIEDQPTNVQSQQPSINADSNTDSMEVDRNNEDDEEDDFEEVS